MAILEMELNMMFEKRKKITQKGKREEITLRKKK